MTFEGSRVYILLVLSVSLVIFLAAGQKESPNLGVEWEKDSDSDDIYADCPSQYPSFGTLGKLLTTWNPNVPEVPEGYVETLQVLNYSDPAQKLQAEFLRDCELPFKVYGVPIADAVSRKWTDDYLEKQLGDCSKCKGNVMRSDSNRFMFWHIKSPGAVDGKVWNPPTSHENMEYIEWRQWANQADKDKIGPTDEHYYFTMGVPPSAKTPGNTGLFVADDLTFFSTRTENFFVTNVARQKGIQCRLGGRGIIAESHFDHGKNFVLMLRGRKRYLLNPPRACPALGIISDDKHPSYRHSAVDWSNEAEWPEGFADAPALDTVVEQGELLYIPSFWYHYIVSEGFSVQCNARSGLSERPEWIRETEACLGKPLGGGSKGNGKYGGRPRGDGGHENRRRHGDLTLPERKGGGR